MLLSSDHPRRHHYDFAHRILPTILLDPDVDLVALAAAGNLVPALLGTWDNLAVRLPDDQRLPPTGLDATLVNFGDWPGLVITLPRAEHATEAHFVAIAPAAPASQRVYYTLEHSWTLEDEPSTVIGSWTESRHNNHGPGPEPAAEAFVSTLRERFVRLGDR